MISEKLFLLSYFSLSLTSTRVFFSLSLSTSLSLMLLSTPTVPPAQPLLHLTSFDKSGLGLLDYPETHKSLSPLPPTLFSETHTVLRNLLKAVDGVNQLLVVYLRWSPTVLGVVLKHATPAIPANYFPKVVILKFTVKESI